MEQDIPPEGRRDAISHFKDTLNWNKRYSPALESDLFHFTKCKWNKVETVFIVYFQCYCLGTLTFKFAMLTLYSSSLYPDTFWSVTDATSSKTN